MKKIILSLLISLSAVFCFAQTTGKKASKDKPVPTAKHKYNPALEKSLAQIKAYEAAQQKKKPARKPKRTTIPK